MWSNKNRIIHHLRPRTEKCANESVAEARSGVLGEITKTSNDAMRQPNRHRSARRRGSDRACI